MEHACQNVSEDETTQHFHHQHHHQRHYQQQVQDHKEERCSKLWSGPLTYTLPKGEDGYGFILRYFVVYPPTPLVSNDTEEKGFDRDSYWLANGLDGGDENDIYPPSPPEPLDTFFVKSVVPGGSAHLAGLNSGDRIVSINGDLIGGKRFKEVVELIQYCPGDIKLGVVPHKDDILQLVYEEYIYDGIQNNNNGENPTSTLTQKSSSAPTSTTNITELKNLKNQQKSMSVMQQPSVNKWSVPITPRKSLTLENNNEIPTCSTSNLPTHGGSTEAVQKKYEPCVVFFGGAPVIRPESRPSRSGSMTSSGSITPHGRSGKVTPTQKRSSINNDPCISWVGGKPQVNVQQPEENPSEQQKNMGVPPIKLQRALRKEQGKKSYSVGTRLAPKQIEGVNKPGAVSNIAGLFANGNREDLSAGSILSRKKSATSVLRDDFPMKHSKKHLDNNNSDMKFNLNVTVDMRRRQSEGDSNVHEMNNNNTNKFRNYERSVSTNITNNNKNQYSKNSARNFINNNDQYKQNNPNFSSSSPKSPSECKKTGSLPSSKSDKTQEDRTTLANKFLNSNAVASPIVHRKRNLLGRKVSISSVENSEDDDSDDSIDEKELNNWNDRRASYLVATAIMKKVEKTKKQMADTEADDEDSDTNTSPNMSTSRSKTNSQKTDDVEKKAGPLNRKLEKSLDNRKKPSARTWKPMYAVLKGHRLFCFKNNTEDGDDEIIQPIPIRGAIIEIASDYAKRRHVFRLVTSHGNVYLFQAEDTASLMSWVNSLRDANPDKESLMKTSQSLKQEKNDDHKDKKGLIRRSHFGIRGIKKGRNNSSAGSGTERKSVIKVATPSKTFGIQLYKCPQSRKYPNVPLIVEHCCRTVEEKGKDSVGVYRIPGNAAAVQLLQQELDTKDTEEINWEDEKWYELHNIGSLLKSFLRQLEDPVIPNMLYKRFITVSQLLDHNDRLKSIKHLTRSLPEYHYETLQFLIRHLKVIADNCDKNKMEPRNIAIVFGPSVVRTSEMAAMVQDMSDQYKIIETLLKQCDWIFDDNENSEPLEMESDSEVISVGISKTLMDCLNNKQNSEQECSDHSPKKVGNKLSTLRSNISMKFKNTSKVVSPKSQKKAKHGSTSQDDETDDDTSGCYSQSPPLSGKNEKTRQNYNNNKHKSKEMLYINAVNSSNNISRQNSNNEKTTTTATNLGSFQVNKDVNLQLQINPPSLRSPELSPIANRKDFGKNTKLTEKTLNRINQLDLSQNNRDYDYKSMVIKDDGNDSGVTSPQRLDSEDSDSGAHSSRKESLDSLSGPSPLIFRRFSSSRTVTRKVSNSGSSNEERSPTLHKSNNLTSTIPQKSNSSTSTNITTLKKSDSTASQHSSTPTTTVTASKEQQPPLTQAQMRSVRRANKSKELAAAAALAAVTSENNMSNLSNNTTNVNKDNTSSNNNIISGIKITTHNNINNISNKNSDEPRVIKRTESTVRRRNKAMTASPRSSKRELHSIIPGDENPIGEKIRALLDPSYDGHLKETATSEMNMPSNASANRSCVINDAISTVGDASTTLNSDSTVSAITITSTKPNINNGLVTASGQQQEEKPNSLKIPGDNKSVVLSGAKTPESGQNAEWWLSGNQNRYRRFANSPKNKAAALNIISSAIDSNRLRKSINNNNDTVSNETDPVLKSTSPSYTDTELSARVDHLKQRNEQLAKRVADMLGPDKPTASPQTSTNVNSTMAINQNKDISITTTAAAEPHSFLSESRVEKFDRYLQQVSDILNEQDKDKLAYVVKQFHNTTTINDNAPTTSLNAIITTPQRTASAKVRLNSDGAFSEKSEEVIYRPVIRSKSAAARTQKSQLADRTSPFLDETYSKLNYSKLYPR